MGAVILDRLRVAFPYLVAVALPLAGIVIAVVRYSQGDHEDALRIALAAFLGMCLYGLLLA
jgi:drug/metabolite transporter (DMT)-like permease